MKNTRTRIRVRNVLEEAQSPMTAYDIFDKLKEEHITLSSIYRTLDTFTEEHITNKDIDNHGTALYTIHSEHHCHYLECKNCHKKIVLDYCPYHKVNQNIKNKTEFEIDEQNVVLYGTCKDCKKKNPVKN